MRHGCNATRGVALGCHDTGSGSPRQGRGTLVTVWRSRSRHVEYSALIPLLQRQVLCVDTTASTPSTLR